MKKLITFVFICASMIMTACNKGDDPVDPEQKKHALTVHVVDNGKVAIAINGSAVSTEETKVVEGATVTLTATPATGCQFDGWTTTDITINDKMTESVTFAMPAKNVSITPAFSDLSPKLILFPVENGTVTISIDGKTVSTSETKVAEGATVSLAAAPAAGYRFYAWASVGITLDNPIAGLVTFTMPAVNVKIKVAFLKIGTEEEGVEINGIKWATRNVGAPGTFAETHCDYGMHYQWNRNTAWYDENGVLKSIPAGATWPREDPTGTVWDPAVDPSPAGWRVPTHAEFASLCDLNRVGRIYVYPSDGIPAGYRFTDQATGNSVFFPATGSRACMNESHPDGTLINDNQSGLYWSGEQYEDYTFGAYCLKFHSAYITPHAGTYRVYGLTIRPVAK